MIQDSIHKFLEALKVGIAQNARKRGQDKRGRIGASLRTEFFGDGGRLLGWRWIEQRLEFGRGSTINKVSKGKTLRESLLDWLNRENIGDEKRRKSIAYLMAKKIHEHGDKLYRGEDRLKPPTGTISDVIERELPKFRQNSLNEVKADILEQVKKMRNVN